MKKKYIKNLLIILIVSVLITFTFDFMFGGTEVNYRGVLLNIIYGATIGISISISGAISRFVFKKSSIEVHPIRTYIILLISIFVYISIDVIVVNALWFRFTQGVSFKEVFTDAGIIISTVITIFIGLTIFFILLSKNFMTRLLDAEKVVQEAKQEADRFKFETLKSQINPHFLFNSLNSLSSLIHIDADKADEFTNKLSSIYRYILDHQDDELVTLEQELDFVKEYASLQAIRFDNNFKLNIKDTIKHDHKLLIPLSLQLVIENVFKHNIVSEKNIITITITIIDDFIIVKNNKNLKASSAVSHNVGLNNIIARYKLICDKKCIIEDSETEFVIKLPLIANN